MTLLCELDVCDSPEGKPTRSGVVKRVTQVMDVFSPARPWARLEDVADHTGLPRSTAFRILRQLVELDWLEHGPEGFGLGRRLQELHGCATDYTDIRAAASAVLTDLNLKTAAVCHLGVLEGSFVHYLDKIGGTVMHSVPSHVGARLGAEETVTGRALLARLAPEDVDHRYAADHRSTTRDGLSIDVLHRRLERIRRSKGLAYSHAERCGMGISSVAAPVLGPHGVVAAISVASRRTMQLEVLGPVVAAAARTTGVRLFPDWYQRLQSEAAPSRG
jgi:DNA-binding IclR family transcriptional regulator